MKPKRSTLRGDGRAKMVAALTKYHEYSDESCLNQAPIGVGKLAKLANVSKSTASSFFTAQFGGWKQYRATCQDTGSLIGALKTLNGEFTPLELSRCFPEPIEPALKINRDD